MKSARIKAIRWSQIVEYARTYEPVIYAAAYLLALVFTFRWIVGLPRK